MLVTVTRAGGRGVGAGASSLRAGGAKLAANVTVALSMT